MKAIDELKMLLFSLWKAHVIIKIASSIKKLRRRSYANQQGPLGILKMAQLCCSLHDEMK